LISSFPSALVAAIREPEDYRESILGILRAGGDSAGRGAMAGAWLGAALGVKTIPEDWWQRVKAAHGIEAAVDKILSFR